MSIHNVTLDGKGVGRYQDRVVFVPDTLPGDDIEFSVISEKKNYWIGQLVRIITPSKIRIPSDCSYFEECGGCQFQNISYLDELNIKQDVYHNNILRIAKIENYEASPIIPSKDINFYRNKIKLFPNPKGFGFYKKNTNQIVPIEKCLISHPLLNEIIPQLNQYFYEHLKLIESIQLKISNHDQTIMLIVQLDKFNDLIVNQLRHLIKHNLKISSGYIKTKKKYHLIEGNEYITETILQTIFRFGPDSFFQINPSQAETMFQLILDNQIINKNHKVVDAYGGVGVLGILLSSLAKEVVTIEINKEAAEFAAENCFINKVSNMNIVHGDVKDWLVDNLDQDVLIIDPPRKGMDKNIVTTINKTSIHKIIYISCNSATLARDINRLKESGWTLYSSQSIDMFPRTGHIESVSILKKE